jgi:hypothetical protein
MNKDYSKWQREFKQLWDEQEHGGQTKKGQMWTRTEVKDLKLLNDIQRQTCSCDGGSKYP